MRFWTRQVHVWWCVLWLLTACSIPEQTPPTPGEPEKDAGAEQPQEKVPVEAKIATAIRTVIQRLRDDGITATNAVARQAATYSNALVRVDPEGRVHTAIVLTHIDAQVMAMLMAQHVRIERRDDVTYSLHSWIPFEHLETVAAMPFVRFVRPPRYASRR